MSPHHAMSSSNVVIMQKFFHYMQIKRFLLRFYKNGWLFLESEGYLDHRELLIIPCIETDDEGGPNI
jgi:hypothetical protein